MAVVEPVTVVLNGEALPAAAFLSDLPGVYQVTVQVPASRPPGIDQPLRLRQGGTDSNAVPVTLQ
jgi:uncharacterized protein (TIGR03437 family)